MVNFPYFRLWVWSFPYFKKKIRTQKYSTGGGRRKRNERSRYKDDLPLLLYYEGERREIFLFQENRKWGHLLGRGSKEEGIQRLEIVAMKKEGKKTQQEVQDGHF